MNLFLKVYHKLTIVSFFLFLFISLGISRAIILYRYEEHFDKNISFFERIKVETDVKNMLCVFTAKRHTCNAHNIEIKEKTEFDEISLNVSILEQEILQNFLKSQEVTEVNSPAIDMLSHLHVLTIIPYKHIVLTQGNNFYTPTEQKSTDKYDKRYKFVCSSFDLILSFMRLPGEVLREFMNDNIMNEEYFASTEITEMVYYGLFSAEKEKISLDYGLIINGNLCEKRDYTLNNYALPGRYANSRGNKSLFIDYLFGYVNYIDGTLL
ncbi:hypothetical protein CDIK_1010 [Cucumispora dikerogammari]|nr:hypothetical protein CDIK_1010 [Cucumispora dikerogammari]